MKDGISVIIPCYNSALTIKRCIDSVLSQDLTNKEIICVDDASEDDTLDKISYFDSVQIIKNTVNKGSAYSRNIGLERASQAKLLFLDSDIFLPPGFLKEINRLAQGCELVYPKILYEDGREFSLEYIHRNIYSRKARNYPLCSACFLIRKSAISKLDEFFDETYRIYYEDTDLFLRCYYFKVISRFAENITAYHVHRKCDNQLWSRKRLYMECRNTLYAIIKFFPLNFVFPVNYTVRLGMFVYYFKMLCRGRIEGTVDYADFLRIVGKAAVWNFAHLFFTFKKNMHMKLRLINFRLMK